MRLAFGFMTGTSLDGLDAAAVRVDGTGLDLRLVDIPAAVSRDFPSELSDALRALSSGQPAPARDIARAARELGELHAEAARDLIARVGRPDLACAHGQTVFHAPPDSWQLFNPWPLARATGCPVVYDLRGADLAAGGQGAPITPVADWVLFRDPRVARAIVNLGGFCNITVIPRSATPESVRGADVCACNHLLNAAARLALHEPFDRGGAAAQRGSPSGRAVDAFAAALGAQRAAGRSLGSGDELASMLRTHGEGLAPNDLLASVCAAVARVVAGAVREHAPDAVYLAGGSALNGALATALRADLSPIPVEPLDALGVPAQRREAAAFAVLGALCADRTPITLPAITGCASLAPISGAWIDPRTP